jgi:hypothetical protein
MEYLEIKLAILALELSKAREILTNIRKDWEQVDRNPHFSSREKDEWYKLYIRSCTNAVGRLFIFLEEYQEMVQQTVLSDLEFYRETLTVSYIGEYKGLMVEIKSWVKVFRDSKNKLSELFEYFLEILEPLLYKIIRIQNAFYRVFYDKQIEPATKIKRYN